MPSLIVVGKKRTEEFPLTDAVTVIGRDKGVNLELSDFKASRRHALLVQTEVGCFVKDLGSRNGVSLNQARIASRGQLPVKNGDVISLGSTTLVFKDLSGVAEDEGSLNAAIAASASAVASAPAAAASAAAPAPASTPATPRPARRVAKPPSAVMRTTPRERPPVRGEAEALLMQALERADRERSFYRWLSLGLLAVLVIVLLLSLVVALRSPQASSPPAADVETEVDTPLAVVPTAAFELDSRRFANGVHRVLAERCAACHATAGRGGSLVLVGGSDAESVRANRLAAAQFVIAGSPAHSPLVSLPSSPDHAGGVVLREDDPDYASLYAWVTTPAPAQPPPSEEASTNRSLVLQVAALEGELSAGVALTLDASGSSDPDGDRLHYRWVLSAYPAGSSPSLDGAAQAIVSFVPEVAGDYEATVIVHDGMDSIRKAIAFRVGVELEARAGARLAVFERLAQRKLEPGEAERLEALSREELARQLLAEEGFFAGWWDAELEHLGLTGASRPAGEPWVSMPMRLQREANTPLDALFALAVGSKWNRRYAGRDAFVTAVLDRLLAAKVDSKTREAAAQLYDGYSTSYLGVTGTSSADLVKITLDDPRALEGVLRRGLAWIGQRPPSEPDLREALGWTEGSPGRVFESLARWASRDL